MITKYRFLPLFFLLALMLFSAFQVSCEKQQNTDPATESLYLQTVKAFADSVLANGRDEYGEEHSPLFVDGIKVSNGEPVRWVTEGDNWIISNFGTQQNLMRTLVGLSALTGDEKYEQAAREATRYMLDHQSDSLGLLYWGGHQFVDLATMDHQFKGRPHELKNNFPFYEFMWEVDSTQTKAMLRAIWNAHILDWSNLDLNRHGEYDMQMGALWDHQFEKPKPFFEGDGLTFINAGTDMIQVAMTLYALDKDEQAREWGSRLYEQYVRARHPGTGLGVYQYSQPEREEEPPSEGPLTGELTYSKYGDRAQNQFAGTYGDIALEGNVLWGRRVQTLYGRSAVMLLHLAKQLGDSEAGRYLKEHTVDGLKSLARYAYDPEQNHFKPMWTDGTDLSDDVMPRTGYYGEKGTPFPFAKPDGPMLLAYAKAARITNGDSLIWSVVRSVFRDEGLGDPGEKLGAEPSLNLNTEQAKAGDLVAILELYQATHIEDFLELAERVGNNIIEQHYFDGYFLPSEDHVYTKFDYPEPLALLSLEAARQGKEELVPPYLTGSGETDGEPMKGGRPSDEWLYEATSTP